MQSPSPMWYGAFFMFPFLTFFFLFLPAVDFCKRQSLYSSHSLVLGNVWWPRQMQAVTRLFHLSGRILDDHPLVLAVKVLSYQQPVCGYIKVLGYAVSQGMSSCTMSQLPDEVCRWQVGVGSSHSSLEVQQDLVWAGHKRSSEFASTRLPDHYWQNSITDFSSACLLQSHWYCQCQVGPSFYRYLAQPRHPFCRHLLEVFLLL